MLFLPPKYYLSDRETTTLPTGLKIVWHGQWRPPVPAGLRTFFYDTFELAERAHSPQLGLLRRSGWEGWPAGCPICNGADEPNGGKTEKWPYVGKCPLPSTGPGASRRKAWPRSEKDPCSENQIEFRQNRFRFRQNVILDHPLCRRRVMHIYQTSLQSYRIEFSDSPSSGRQHSGLQLARCLGQPCNRGSQTE